MKAFPIKLFFIVLGCAVALGAFGYGGYRYYELREEYASLKERAVFLDMTLEETSKKLADMTLERDIFEQSYYAEKKRMGDLALQISTIQSTVGVFEKLQTLDPEFLQKYSKVYFLNENYAPKALAEIESQYVYETAKKLFVEERAWPYLKNLLDGAQSASVDVKIISAFRSFGEQAVLKSEYSVLYGTGANQFSADQGYSEHQLGTAVDVTTQATGADFYSFENTPAHVWLIGHAHEYGFVLSYPEDNAYYRFEPWHWRFVGRNLAEKLHAENKQFYDMDQRILDTYLISIFD